MEYTRVISISHQIPNTSKKAIHPMKYTYLLSEVFTRVCIEIENNNSLHP